jgi:hypothetical protein
MDMEQLVEMGIGRGNLSTWRKPAPVQFCLPQISYDAGYLLGLQASKLKMEATCSSKMLVDFQWTTRHYIPENRVLHNHLCENLIPT